jgi:4a-hydroxytetrahydrobiopterin dehydratase
MTTSALAAEAISLHYKDATALQPADIAPLLPALPAWSVQTLHDVMQLQRTFTFNNFAQALAFTNSIGELAEQANHHPALLTEWGSVTVRWWTHVLDGLHRNDFIMAARCEATYAASSSMPCSQRLATQISTQ